MNEPTSLTTGISSKPRTWLALCVSKNIMRRSLLTSLIVGTILVIINHGDALITGEIDSVRVFRIILTYLVPYLVSTTSSVSTILSFQSTHLFVRK
jgi:hypothetical protein